MPSNSSSSGIFKKMLVVDGGIFSCSSASSTAVESPRRRSFHRINSYLHDQLPFNPRRALRRSASHKPVFSVISSSSSSSSSSAATSTVVVEARRKSSADVMDLLKIRNNINHNNRDRLLVRRSPSGGSSRYLLLEASDHETTTPPHPHPRHQHCCYSQEKEKGEEEKEEYYDNNNYNRLVIVPSEPALLQDIKRRGSSCGKVIKKRGEGDRDLVNCTSNADRHHELELDRSKTSSRLHKDHKFKSKSTTNSSSSPPPSSSSSSSFSSSSSRLNVDRTDIQRHSVKSPAAQPKRHQVVTLRVSLHCKGCEAKLKKHLSKMQGVTSFNIDRETKKVSVHVVGNLSPSELLTSISKVKKAELWPAFVNNNTTTSSASSISTYSTSSYSSNFGY